ncbi:response regulator [Pseudomonas sp. S75]|uniref:ATP-binding protein n=1 Tax=unclassified Pseudomonas TaxID=196821 RepID=UPI001907840E|nr:MULTISPECIES: ATP-binding protein [unclassified Pseudomonas]MBJ9975024.1 response regulator [Pseudomonas sp. S30]MBK0152861.1 response regulator [Pseudomonas sp. S75]
MACYKGWTVRLVKRWERARWHDASRYLGAIVIVALCCIGRAQMPATALPYLFFIPGLMLIGFWFGIGPSALGCTLAVFAAQYFFIGPLGFTADWGSWANSASFGVVTFIMALVCALLRRSLNALGQANLSLISQAQRRKDERDSLWNLSPDLICTLSDEGGLLTMNPAWERQTGWSDQQLREGAFDSLISPSQIVDALRSLNDRPVAELDTQSVRSDGQPLWLNWRIAGRPGRYTAIARDVTQLRERQQAFEQVSSQLQQSQKMQALGQLTSGLAHDFNNLLTVITNTQDMIDKRLAQGRHGELQRYVALARTATRRASSLTQRLLAYARRQPPASEAVDAGLLIDDMKDLIGRTLTPQIDFDVLASASRVLCYCDVHQLESAVMNLCLNARDAMPQGGRLLIEVLSASVGERQADTQLRAGEYVHVRVSDTGTGMPDSVAEKAFEPFFTTKPLGSGTGLGLSMVRDFALQAGGTARIESKLGQGTRVSLFLPVHADASVPAASDDGDLLIDTAARLNGWALVLDDEAAVRELLVEVLRDMGLQVTEAATAEQALAQMAERADLHLLVTDLILHGPLRGDAVAAQGRALHPRMRVLFVSGFIDAAEVVSQFPERVAHLAKPFTLQQLQANVGRLLDRPVARL